MPVFQVALKTVSQKNEKIELIQINDICDITALMRPNGKGPELPVFT